MKGRPLDKKVRRVILFINPMKQHALELGEKIKAKLGELKIQAEIFIVNEKSKYDSQKKYDIAISLGGDGTVLFAARTMSPLGVPVLPLNLGTFCFIAGVEPDEWLEVFGLWLKGKAPLSRRLMVDIKAERMGKEVIRRSCLNEVVISASGKVKLINLSVSCKVDDYVYTLGSYRSDGLIVSTPTGSTGYSFSAGGPILDPELEVLILNPICPFALSGRPMVLPAEETIIVEVDKEQRSDVYLTIDGQGSERLKSGDRIFLQKAPYYCMLIASGRTGFYDTLAEKFIWAGGRRP